MDTKDFIGLVGVPVVVALVAAFRPFIKDKRVWPLLAIALGVAINAGFAYASRGDLPLAIMTGIVAGLAASGLYSGSKAMVGQ